MAPAQRATEPRVTVIEGRRTLIVERRPPLPPRLDTLLAGLRRYPLRITGWRGECGAQDHRLKLIAEGTYPCPDGISRDLKVYQCADCEAVCVRDISYDRVPGLPTGGRLPLRRNHVLGWYSGARRNQRVYITPR